MIKIIGENKDKDCKFSFAGKYDQLETLNGLKPYYNYYCIVAESADETNFKNLFQACQASIIYFHNFGTSKVTNMKGMFADCNSLVSLNVSSFDTSKVTDMTWMFFLCISPVSLDLSNFNTSNAIDMTEMFYACHSLISLDISSFDFSKVRNTAVMFENCSSLTDLKFGKNLKVSLSLRNCPLTHESALSVINGLAKVKGQQSVSFSEETYDMLTAEDIKKAEDKNWEVK